MDTRIANRIEAFRSVQTLRTKHGATITNEPTLKSDFDALDDKIKTVDEILVDISLHGEGFTKDKNTRRDEACAFGAQLGNATYAMAAKQKNTILKSQASKWCSVSALAKGNRETVTARLRGLLKTVTANAQALIANDYLVDADIVELEAKVKAFEQSLKDKAESVNNQLSTGERLIMTVKVISKLINEELSRSIKSFDSEYPELVSDFTIARKVRSTVAAKHAQKTDSTERQPTQPQPEPNNNDKPAQADSTVARSVQLPSAEADITSTNAA